jgi:DNA excision repair protein ERCC-5
MPACPPSINIEVNQKTPKSPNPLIGSSPKLSFVLSGNLLQSPEKPQVAPCQVSSDSDDDMEELSVEPPPSEYLSLVQVDPQPASSKSPPRPQPDLGVLNADGSTLMTSPTTPPLGIQTEGENEDRLFGWSRTPSPFPDIDTNHPSPPAEEWDAADEIDVHAEEGEFARFMSQMKGKNVDDVRNEIDNEIKGLNQQRKAAIRDSEDITQQMIAQIMVSTQFSLSRNP